MTSRRVGLHTVVLFGAGLVVLAIGVAGLFAPVAFLRVNGIQAVGNVSLLSEVRAAGGVLLAAGVFVTLGAFVTRFTVAAAGVGAVVFLSYGLSRLLGVALDGVPASGLVLAAVVELALGLLCAYAFLRRPTYDVQVETHESGEPAMEAGHGGEATAVSPPGSHHARGDGS